MFEADIIIWIVCIFICIIYLLYIFIGVFCTFLSRKDPNLFISKSDHTKHRHTTKVPNTTLQQTSSPDITTVSNTLYNRTSYYQTTYSSSPQSIFDMTIDYNKTDEHLLQESRLDTIHGVIFCSDHRTHQQTHCQHNFTNSILMADKHNIPNGKMHSNCRLLSDHIV